MKIFRSSWFALVLACLAVAGWWIFEARGADASYGVVERLVTLDASSVTTLVPAGNKGFFIQPQTVDRSIRIGIGRSSSINSTSRGIILTYLEALAEQPRSGWNFHEVKGTSTSGNVSVWVVYYQE